MMSMLNNLYIHIPFCDGKCDYCAFYSAPFTDRQADQYLDSLSTEMDIYLERNEQLSPQTIYIGGGTPSVLNIEQIKKLLGIIKSRVDLSRLTEWTIEMNPGNVDSSLPTVLLDAGVNRISLGAQIFDDTVLKAIGRRHSVSDIVDTVDLLQKAGIRSYNIDLISSLPGVSESLWIESLKQAVDLEPTHVALYNFSVEQGTVMQQRYNKGLLPIVSDDKQLELLKHAAEVLVTAGYGRYEISNYSLPGFESKHNLACWCGDDYLGFGPSASSRLGLLRCTNKADLNDYINALEEKELPPHEEEELSSDIDISERFIFGFRLTSGIDLLEFVQKYLPSSQQLLRWRKVLVRLVAEGLLVEDNEHYRPTERGLDLADYIAGELLV